MLVSLPKALAVIQLNKYHLPKVARESSPLAFKYSRKRKNFLKWGREENLVMLIIELDLTQLVIGEMGLVLLASIKVHSMIIYD